jgi:hypothetical protein
MLRHMKNRLLQRQSQGLSQCSRLSLLQLENEGDSQGKCIV